MRSQVDLLISSCASHFDKLTLWEQLCISLSLRLGAYCRSLDLKRNLAWIRCCTRWTELRPRQQLVNYLEVSFEDP